MIRAIPIDKSSPFLGEECALCKHPFAPPDEIIICPEDGSRHHAPCWQANGNHCTAYGCLGGGEVISTQLGDGLPEPDNGVADTGNRRAREGDAEVGRRESAAPQEQDPPQVTGEQQSSRRRSKVRVLPSSSLSCAQSCLFLGIALAILLFAVGCFGLWAIADYIMLEVLGWQYRAPLSGSIPYSDLLTILMISVGWS